MNEPKLTKTNITNSSLLSDFNSRDCAAFCDIYNLIYKEIYYFAYQLFKNTTIDPKDVLQDIFLKIWNNSSLEFDDLNKLKGYIYIAVRNNFKMYYKHQKIANDACDALIYDEELFTVFAAESEIFSLIPDMLKMLPADCAKSFALFMEGYNAKEIAEKLDKPLSTIYTQKEKATRILKEKFSKYKF